MKRIKLKDRILPTYTKGEEIFNMTSHIVGAVLGVVALVLCVVFAAIRGNVFGVVSGSIYGVTMIILYTMSSIYHGLSPKRYSKKVFQVLDHCSIFLLIAGSYTPFALCTIREADPVSGWVIFGVIWFVAILGIVLNSIDIKKFKVPNNGIELSVNDATEMLVKGETIYARVMGENEQSFTTLNSFVAFLRKCNINGDNFLLYLRD